VAQVGFLDDPEEAVTAGLGVPARIAPQLMSAYGLTEREQDVTRLVLQGNSTSEIASGWWSRPTPSSSTSSACSTRRGAQPP
jgi:hypothetical protein